MVHKFIVSFFFLAHAKAAVIDIKNGSAIDNVPDNVFNGVYSECFLHLSYSCLQKKTLLYLKELNNLSEVSVIGDYVKFVKINKSNTEEDEGESKSGDTDELAFMIDKAIDNFFDNHVLKFYALGRNISMPRNVEEFVGRKKRKGGGGGGGGGHGGGGGGGHDDGGKKKMMMMAMMCMKMKLMMMVPAMMGMMGMMSFKGMMFSMMSFMLSKMMLLMKILEKKGGGPGLGGGGGGGGLDGGWPAAGGGGGAWMPAGGQDYAGGGGGGYDANGQWQSRSIVVTPGVYKTIEDIPKSNKKIVDDEKQYVDDAIENYTVDKWDKKTSDNRLDNIFTPGHNEWLAGPVIKNVDTINKPEISFVSRAVRYNSKMEKESYKKPVLVYKRSNVNFDLNNPENVVGQENESDVDRYKSNLRSKRDIKLEHNRTPVFYPRNYNKNDEESRESKSRQKRSIIDLLQNSYIYWVNRILGLNNNRRTNPQRYKVVNGVKYIYYPYKLQKPKMPKEMQLTEPQNNDLKTLVAVEDFNKGEIVEGAIESRMSKKKFNNIKDTVNDTMEDNPWE